MENYKILVVDDDHEIADAIEIYLMLFLRITYGVRSRNHDLQCRCVQYSGGGS